VELYTEKYEVVIVGSGAGGATLARELAKRRCRVLVIERGRHGDDLRNVWSTSGWSPRKGLPGAAFQGRAPSTIYRAITPGGSTVVSHGNGIRCLQDELAAHGVTLGEELSEAEGELHVSPVPRELMSEGSLRILQASQDLGLSMEPMPKFIDFARCRGCGTCVDGCANGAKWTAREWLQDAARAGADVIYDTRVGQVVAESGKGLRVRGIGPHGQTEVRAQTVVLAAGGLETPVILQRSGIAEAGPGLFADPAVDTYGLMKDLKQSDGLPTALVGTEFHKSKGFILTPFVSPSRRTRLTTSGVRGAAMPSHRLVGIMAKISDEPASHVRADGTVHKPLTERDRFRLRDGTSLARRVLLQAGALGCTIVSSKPRGAHPGGTAAIGRIVDKDLQTRVDGLFVCDASVLPTAPGLPPILTIVALAKRLAKTLA
jgi:choline dehydrogenase-like flavoprotein